MGLKESRIINSVHPWLGARLKWLQEVAVIYGTRQTLHSGNRTKAEQLALYNSQSTRPAAYPGCSQHQYGFAADASYLPISLVTSKGKPIVFDHAQTTSVMNNAARHVGLTVVSGDDGHYQVYPGIQFKAWAVSRGFCPANPPPRPPSLRSLSQFEQACGVGAVGFTRDLFGINCIFPWDTPRDLFLDA